MPKVRKINLNQNEIGEVDGFLESLMPDLEMVSFEANKIKKISKLHFPKLCDISFKGNREL